jgi:hypothetical protein
LPQRLTINGKEARTIFQTKKKEKKKKKKKGEKRVLFFFSANLRLLIFSRQKLFYFIWNPIMKKVQNMVLLLDDCHPILFYQFHTIFVYFTIKTGS